jgi:hypothetical protein
MLVTGMFTGQPDANQARFAGGSLVGAVVIQDWVAPEQPLIQLPIYPVGSLGSPPGGAGRVSQAVLEVAEVPSNAQARVSQSVIEVAELVTTAQARVSQAVLEVITPYYPKFNYSRIGSWSTTSGNNNASGVS